MTSTPQTPPQPGPTPPTWKARLWRHQEWFWWALLLTVLVYMQWPMLRGYYFKVSGAVAPPTAIAWHTDIATALAESKKLNRPVLLDAGADWCPPCITMKHDVWPDPEVTRLVGAGYVPLLIDVDRQPAIASRYDIATIPAVMLLDSDGAVLRRAGYLPRAGMVRFLTDATWDD